MITDIFISPAFAQAAGVANESSEYSFSSLVPLILIFFIFYFLIIRPQTKKIKDHQQIIDNLKIGNKVITSSGIFGKIKNIDNKSSIVELQIAEDVVIKIAKNYISEVDKTEVTKEDNKKTKNKKTKKTDSDA